MNCMGESVEHNSALLPLFLCACAQTQTQTQTQANTHHAKGRNKRRDPDSPVWPLPPHVGGRPVFHVLGGPVPHHCHALRQEPRHRREGRRHFLLLCGTCWGGVLCCPHHPCWSFFFSRSSSTALLCPCPPLSSPRVFLQDLCFLLPAHSLLFPLTSPLWV